MTTIGIVVAFGWWDAVSASLRKMGLELSVENTIQVSDRDIERVLPALWRLCQARIILGFRVDADDSA